MGAEVQPLLEVSNLHVHYGEVHAIRGIDLEVRQGEIVALLGANGAGKSTTINAVMGLVPRSSGTIRFRGEDISRLSASEIASRGIGLCPEGRRVFGNMTVRENLLIGAYKQKDKAQVKEDLERMFQRFPRLRERSGQLAGTLSGGEQQMLAIARALMGRPSMLLLDEPSLGMAPIIIQQLEDIIRSINEDGTTILLVEQNADLALRLATKGYVLSLGQIAYSGDKAELLQNPELTSAYLGGE